LAESLDMKGLREKAESGFCPAQCFLGIYYLNGIDVEVNYQEAFRLLSAAANKGASRAVINLARMYEEGLGIQKNVGEALRLYKSVSHAEFLALVALGRIYSRGTEVPADPAEAFRWYSAAVKWEARVADCEEIKEAKAYVERM
jgi:TPR repeat protein